jgi:acyl-CoA synthetase (AMP-forming)/AMP-acid ligase II
MELVADLASHADAVAVITAGERLTYRQLDRRVHAVADRLGPVRRLVLVAAANDLDSLVTYLGALRAGSPVLLAPPDRPASMQALVDAYDPDVVASRSDGRWAVVERRTQPAHDLHPDLALLLSTSGSTGAAKLVRLSHRNLDANAASIAAYLGIRGADVAATTMPMHYCYGLSVVHSHLRQGAALLLTDLSVVDACFWERFRAEGVTSFAAVPYTFELLDRVGFEAMELPTLRTVTQAGGRLAPATVRRFAQLGRRRGWDLVVMYGQTEATARMAYLPPHLAAERPEAIGRAIPGGELSIDDGELVYRGPNVMLGYATEPADLAVGATLTELRTGDLARVGDDGLFEITGRRSRFAKLFGLRLDLDEIERVLAEHGAPALCAGDDRQLAVATTGDAWRAVALVTERFGLPRSAVTAFEVAVLPRLANGKPDHQAVLRHAPADPGPVDRAGAGAGVAHVFGALLGRPAVGPDDTFVGLGGDSLSYVEVSLHLEELLGHLPPQWHIRSVAELEGLARARSRRAPRLETTVVLRAVAIVAVVGNHVGLWDVPGGAHVLLGVAGFNFARFALPSGRVLRSTARVAVPCLLWLGLVAAPIDDFEWPHALLLHGWLGDADARWGYWYVEALIHLLVVLGVLFAVAPVRRFEQRHPLATPVVLLAATLAVRFDLVGLPELGNRFSRPHEIAWIFVLGWLAARVDGHAQRLALSAGVLVAVAGFFGDPRREVLVAAGLVLTIWLPQVAVPRSLRRVVAGLAAASLPIYLTHWQIFPEVADVAGPQAALAASLAFGMGGAVLIASAPGWWRRAARGVVAQVSSEATRASTSARAGLGWWTATPAGPSGPRASMATPWRSMVATTAGVRNRDSGA